MGLSCAVHFAGAAVVCACRARLRFLVVVNRVRNLRGNYFCQKRRNLRSAGQIGQHAGGCTVSDKIKYRRQANLFCQKLYVGRLWPPRICQRFAKDLPKIPQQLPILTKNICAYLFCQNWQIGGRRQTVVKTTRDTPPNSTF